MSSDKMSKGDKRRSQILEAVEKTGEITIPQVMERFSCSEATARRDLNLLADANFVIRTIGGASSKRGVLPEMSFREKEDLLPDIKETLAVKAASFIEEGDIIGLTGGTTTFHIARQIKNRSNITVVTNAVNIAMELADSDTVQTVLTGGVLRSKSYEMCGPLAESVLEKLNIGKMFVGLDGISLGEGLTTYSELEAQIGRLMIERSKMTIAVFDNTKVNRTSLFTLAPLSAVHRCITDMEPDEEWKKRLRELGIKW
ncbi:DeoR/GlpR family DNA-binding transcription regulator [Paenibacillus beijingensis]|uniref:DeoR faimly transcriptional regulator n=1 Tax=Paenibacillus beijingensis TaxID=1126833 RepID=A0A0D5NL58_9BACL|nr:DeoR/GlpR family DNA-binding transcription regulator [Paenibacillus beijingensis]AJY75638.1 DeoR faimly transcriptional regulator [Paenibacillus beijingensis]